MRRKIVAGNWKMNKTLQDAVALASKLNELLNDRELHCEVIVAPPFIDLVSVSRVVCGKIKVAAQNCSDKESGAYTGEVSAEMVKSTGAQYVILGHSERRDYYNETNELIRDKVLSALCYDVTPIFCFGEVLAERESGTHFDVVKKQLEESVFNLTSEQFKGIILAYEPVWAIGTGKTASPEQAQEMHAYVRTELAAKYGQALADEMSILYGGSCKPSNAKEIFSKPDVDGGLIGGASLVAEDFVGIIDAF